MEFSAEQLAEMLHGTVEGDKNAVASTFAKIEEGRPGALSFLANPKYIDYIYSTDSSIVLVQEDLVLSRAVKATLVRVADPYLAVAELMRIADQVLSPKREGIDARAVVSEKVKIGKNVYLGANVVIDDGAEIGDGVQIYPNSYVGANAKIGEGSLLYSGVNIYKGCIVGKNCILHSGCVLGSDGFGFAPNDKGEYEKIPQIGIVMLEDNVEIGANATLDRSTMGATVVHKGVKIDNLVHIAHNVEVGENTVMAALTGIAGSTKIGRNCMFGGQSGVTGHVSIADNTTLAAHCGVSNSIKTPGKVYHFGPNMEAMSFKKSFICFKQLPDTVKVVSDTEKQLREAMKKIEKLEEKVNELTSGC